MAEFKKNLSERCASDNVIPSIPEYLSATTVYGITLVTIGTLAVILILIMFIDTLAYIMKNSSPKVKAHSAFVIGVYPVLSLATYFAILVPRAHLLGEALTQGVFMAAMYQLFCLFVAYAGGEAELIRKVKPGALNLQVTPCCCWPCCFFLPSIEVTKATIQGLRLLVLQLPLVQMLVYLTLLVMWAESESLYQVNYMYLQPIIVTSILFGVWGMAMTINLLKNITNDEFYMVGKFLVLQLVLILAKMQGLATRSLVWTGVLPCRPPITPAVYGNLIHNTLMLAEMVVLQFIARKLYKKTLPKHSLNKNVETESRKVEYISTIGGLMAITERKDNNNQNQCENFNVILERNQGGQLNVAFTEK